MRQRFAGKRLSLAQQFTLTSFVIVVAVAIGMGVWLGEQIEAGVIRQTGATTAAFVDSIVELHLQQLGHAEALTLEHTDELSRLLQGTALGRKIVTFKIWDRDGRILFSSDPSSIGRVFPIGEALARAWRGDVTARLSDLDSEENVSERAKYTQLIETYSPVHLLGTDQIIAVTEFYQTFDDLALEISAAQGRGWLVVGVGMSLIYLLLVGFVQ